MTLVQPIDRSVQFLPDSRLPPDLERRGLFLRDMEPASEQRDMSLLDGPKSPVIRHAMDPPERHPGKASFEILGNAGRKGVEVWLGLRGAHAAILVRLG